jgi:prepilin-type N-terminal cleavage/methylation domain-containing protein
MNVRPRRAFTLVEILTAITITGLVVSLGYGALNTIRSALSALERSGVAEARDARFRALVSEALQHPAPAGGVDMPVFSLVPGADTPRLLLWSRGVSALGGAGAPLEIAVWWESGAVRFAAREGSEGRVLASSLPDARDFRILVSDPLTAHAWTDRWHSSTRAPARVALRWTTAHGAQWMVVSTTLEEVR